jgi:hypothetical protein
VEFEALFQEHWASVDRILQRLVGDPIEAENLADQLESEIVRCLGWLFVRNFTDWHGPIIQFMFEARVIGGEPRGSEEGLARIYSIEAFPKFIFPERRGSWSAITAYLAGRGQKKALGV